jgi:hypothetical protein
MSYFSTKDMRQAVYWLTWFVFHESDICTNCRKLNFQRWKYVEIFCRSWFFVAMVWGWELHTSDWKESKGWNSKKGHKICDHKKCSWVTLLLKVIGFVRQKWDGTKTHWLIETCVICSTKLKFQSVKKNMSNLCCMFCYSCFVAINPRLSFE